MKDIGKSWGFLERVRQSGLDKSIIRNIMFLHSWVSLWPITSLTPPSSLLHLHASDFWSASLYFITNGFMIQNDICDVLKNYFLNNVFWSPCTNPFFYFAFQLFTKIKTWSAEPGPYAAPVFFYHTSSVHIIMWQHRGRRKRSYKSYNSSPIWPRSERTPYAPP